MINTIVLLGAGNVATHLGETLQQSGNRILQVYSRTEKAASELAGKLGCEHTTNVKDLVPGADLYILSVTDSAIEKIIKVFPFEDVLVAHTSGSTDVDVLKIKNIRPAVFYPLQTFSKDVKVDFSEVPLLIEAANDADLEKLKELAGSISSKVYTIDSKQRTILHIAAVFACNFTNHMLSIAGDLLESNDMSFEILKPLIEETVRKAAIAGPAKSQTGPAARNDQRTIKLHSEMLSEVGDYQKIYNFITDSIISKRYSIGKKQDR